MSNHRGTVATVDGEGRDVVLVWLFDHRGGYAVLVIDAETGKSQQIPMPFPPGGDCPYASILSSTNKYYTHFNSHFTEFDPVKREFTFVHQTAPQMAMSMTEDDRGVIWSVTYPNSGLVSYNPATGEFKDYGHLHKENWLQYPRHIAADDQGWIYFGIGTTTSHILAFDPAAGQVKEVVPAAERVLRAKASSIATWTAVCTVTSPAKTTGTGSTRELPRRSARMRSSIARQSLPTRKACSIASFPAASD